MSKPFSDSDSKKALKALEELQRYCHSRDKNCGDCVFAADLDGACLFKDSSFVGESGLSAITRSEILNRATELE